jgi:uncharacterized protein (TIGR00304 family)
MRNLVRPSRLLGPALFIVGAVALAVGVLQGEATLSLFLIFPVVTATGAWGFLGILLMIAGVFVFFLTWSAAPDLSHETVPAAPPATPAPPVAPPSERRSRWGGVVFLGPIPIVFGSNAKVTKWMLLVGVLLFVALVVFTVIVLYGI